MRKLCIESNPHGTAEKEKFMNFNDVDNIGNRIKELRKQKTLEEVENPDDKDE